MPSLVTDDYCRKAFEIVEGKIAKTLSMAENSTSIEFAREIGTKKT